MNWYANSWKKEYFLITPEEFEAIFSRCHFVVTNTGVDKGYRETDPNTVFERYRKLYSELSSGREFNWRDDWETVSFNTGITMHMENCRYSPSTRRSVPDFSEPCIDLEAFCVICYKGSPMSKGWSITQFPQNTIGLQISIPKKITFPNGQSKLLEEFSDHSTWNDIISKIKKTTKVWKAEYNGKLFNSNIRVSPKAKADLAHFFAVKELNLKLYEKDCSAAHDVEARPAPPPVS